MNKALCEASSHLGMAKNAIKMSAEAFLGQVNVLYQRVNSNDSKKSLGQTFSSIKLHCTVKYGFYSVARFRRSAAVSQIKFVCSDLDWAKIQSPDCHHEAR